MFDNTLFQVSRVLKTTLIPIIIAYLDGDVLLQYLRLIAFGFLYYLMMDFGYFAAITNRLAQKKKIPLFSLTPIFIGFLTIIVFKSSISNLIKVEETHFLLFILYYLSNSLFAYFSGESRANNRYSRFLMISGIMNILEIFIFSTLISLKFSLVISLIIVAVIRITSLLMSINLFSLNYFSYSWDFNLQATRLGFYGVTNSFNNHGTLLLLSAVGLSAEMSLLYFTRMWFRPMPLLLRYYCDDLLSKYGALSFEASYSKIRRSFEQVSTYFIILLVGITTVSMISNYLFTGETLFIYVLFMALEMYYIIYRTPLELTLMNFENNNVSGIKYFFVYNTGLAVLILFWFFEPRLEYIFLSSTISSMLVYFYVKKSILR